jgi:putative membrane protein
MPFGYGGPGVGWGGAMFGLLVFVVFIVIVVWAILAIARERPHLMGHYHHDVGHGRTEPSSDALEILNERFARGEIDAAEYTERRDLLKGPS